MRTVFLALGTALCVTALGQSAPPTPSISDATSLIRFLYPLSKPVACPPVTVDTSDFPQGAGYGAVAKMVVETWFTPITQLLGTQGFRRPRTINLVIKKHIDAPAATGGDTITIDGQYIAAHPNDLGMIVHELTHVVQQYPDATTTPGWLVEGVADFIRWWKYEPAPPGPRFSATATYHDAYRTTAAFLAWVSEHYDQRLVPMLDKAMRDAKDPLPIFKKLTGKEPQELWDEMPKRL